MTADPLLRVRDLSVTVAGQHLLHGLNFDVPAQGTTVLLGRNGAGKTTTARAIIGLRARGGHIDGSVELDGERLDRLPTHAVIRRGIGYIPEDRGVFGGLTVAENLRLAEPSGTPPRYDRVYDLFPDLAVRARQRAGTLSGGQQQMLAIGRVLLTDRRLLVVDEPTKGLAPKVVADVTRVLELVAATVPLLLVEQNLAVVRRLAGHAVVLADGHLAWTGTATQLLSEPALTTSLLGVAVRPQQEVTQA
jgi:branched-chain amino acid transport system ATP-binding protein